MRLTTDVEFLKKSCCEVGLDPLSYIINRCGEGCRVLEHDPSDNTVRCDFGGEDLWVPQSCLVEDESEEPEQFPQVETPASLKTLRDEIAIAAMESLLLSRLDEAVKIDEVKLAEMSYKISDAMMEARKK